MVEFIVSQLVKQRSVSLDSAVEKYKAYFFNTLIYSKYKDEVDSLVKARGYEEILNSF